MCVNFFRRSLILISLVLSPSHQCDIELMRIMTSKSNRWFSEFGLINRSTMRISFIWLAPSANVLNYSCSSSLWQPLSKISSFIAANPTSHNFLLIVISRYQANSWGLLVNAVHSDFKFHMKIDAYFVSRMFLKRHRHRFVYKQIAWSIIAHIVKYRLLLYMLQWAYSLVNWFARHWFTLLARHRLDSISESICRTLYSANGPCRLPFLS